MNWIWSAYSVYLRYSYTYLVSQLGGRRKCRIGYSPSIVDLMIGATRQTGSKTMGPCLHQSIGFRRWGNRGVAFDRRYEAGYHELGLSSTDNNSERNRSRILSSSVCRSSFLCVSELSSGVLEVSSSTDPKKPRRYDPHGIRWRLSNARRLGLILLNPQVRSARLGGLNMLS